MAKSVRASVSKRNRAKLRATVFGPAVDARTERLSAKLQELASHAKEQERSSMELDITGTGKLAYLNCLVESWGAAFVLIVLRR